MDAAAEQAISLSILEFEGNAAALYQELHPDAKALISEPTVSGWYQTDFFPLNPQPISRVTAVDFVSWTWDVTGEMYHNTAQISFVQPFGVGANQYEVTETVRLVEHSDGRWGWFFGRSSEFVEKQRAIHDPNGSVAPPTQQPVTRKSRESSTSQNTNRAPSNRTSSQSSKRTNQSCTLVELRPGYPGYRGLVTGLSQQWGGLGDWECLENLERNHPQFNKSEQDRLNSESARRLGINGEPDVWLWENWMAIEAKRDLPPQCYSCLLLDMSVVPINTSISQDWTDPRIQVGFMDSTSAIDIYLPSPQMRDNFVDNYQLRAHAFFIGGPGSNALDLLQIYNEIGMEQHWVDLYAVDYMLSLGGYTWTSSRAYPQDQEFSIRVAFLTSTYRMPPPVRSSVLSNIDNLLLQWKAELATGSNESLADFLLRNY